MAGIPVLGVTQGIEAGRYSRFLTLDPGVLVESNEERLIDRLLSTSEKLGVRGVLIPTSDYYIEVLVRYADKLAQAYHFQASYNEATYKQLVNKARFYELCERHGIAYPPAWESSREHLHRLIPTVRYPCLIKPSLIHAVKDFIAGRKAFVAHTESDLREIVRLLPESDSTWVLQEIVPGPESNIALFGAYFDQQSRAHQSFTCKKLRQHPPGFGSASLVRSAVLDDTRRLSEDFLYAIGFSGIAGTEFKYDERDKKLKIIEINPRPTLWFGAAHHAGKRIALAAFCDLVGRPMPDEAPQRNDVLWRYLGKDLYSQWFYRIKGKSFVLPPPDVRESRIGVRKRVGPLSDWRDPGPALGELANYLNKMRIRSRAGQRFS